MNGDKLEEINLFDHENVPALSVEPSDVIMSYSDDEDVDDDGDECQHKEDDHAVLYVGMSRCKIKLKSLKIWSL